MLNTPLKMKNRKKISASRQAPVFPLALLVAGFWLLFAPARSVHALRLHTAAALPLPADTVAPAEETEKTYKIVEMAPQYPGGEAALLRDIGANLKYPASAMEQKIEGTVVLRFLIGKDGKVGKVVVLRSLNKECDQAAVDAVKKLRKFYPGIKNDKRVAVWFTVPVRFALK